MKEKLTGIILAGGESKRMGQNKALIHFEGKMLIEHSILLMQSVCDEVIISANHPDYKTYGLPVIKDNYISIGPLAGIEASLSYSKTTHNLVISCDTPFVDLGILYEILKNRKDNLAIVPRLSKDKIEPLVAYYSKEILSIIREQIKNNNYKIQDLFEKAETKFIDFGNKEIFKNLNTPTDLNNNSINYKKCFSNLILIAGDGRNVGKTFLACKIISHLSGSSDVIGIKISSHIHENETGDTIVCKNENFVIYDEKSVSLKDSSLMLQAGAKRVFYIIAKQENLKEAFFAISDELKNHSVVCESGGLLEIVQPWLFLYVKNQIVPVQKQNLLKYSPIVISNHQNNLILISAVLAMKMIELP